MTEQYRIADRNIRIESLYAPVHRLCRDYLCADGEPDFTAAVTAADIAFERTRSASEWPDEYIETLAVYRKIAEKMPEYDTVLMHGSAIAVDGETYIFTAPSGTGKSTHARLWRELFGDRAVMVNDDKPLIRIRDAEVTVFGTPWNGKHHLGANIAVPLKAICLLGRAEVNQICEISAREAYPVLLRQIYRPLDPAAMARTLALIDKLQKNVRFYRLGCNMEPDAAQVAYEGMKGTV